MAKKQCAKVTYGYTSDRAKRKSHLFDLHKCPLLRQDMLEHSGVLLLRMFFALFCTIWRVRLK